MCAHSCAEGLWSAVSQGCTKCLSRNSFEKFGVTRNKQTPKVVGLP